MTTPVATTAGALSSIRDHLHPLTGALEDFDPLLASIGDSRVVLIGEASHGTHEFYRLRAQLTKRLIAEKGFTAVALEADWPDALRVSRFAHGAGEDGDAEEALRGFERFPTWMWRNAEMADFVGWLRDRRDRGSLPVSVFGLDLYSLHRSIHAVVDYLDGVDPQAAARARQRYACLERFEDAQHYAYVVERQLTDACEREVVHQLVDLQRTGDAFLRRDGIAAEDEQFYAEQNAQLVVAAERYYRSMFAAPRASWNLRDRHMAETLKRLLSHLSRGGDEARVVVWAHNSHVGDARRTQMAERGELNLGQLARERYATDAYLVGMSTYEGTVSAATDWGGPVQRKRVLPALRGSHEALLHKTGVPAFSLLLREEPSAAAVLHVPRLERAIGVIYRPETERQSHYLHADLGAQFDALLHIDRTRALEPLEPTKAWVRGEPPETYPTSL